MNLSLRGIAAYIFGRTVDVSQYPVAILVDDGNGTPVPLKLSGGSLPISGTATTSPVTATTVKSTALEASHVLKASAGSLVSLQYFNTGPDQYLLIMDSASVPANGAVVLLCAPIRIPADSGDIISFPFPLVATNGISICNSSTGTFTKTIGSADCIFSAQVI